LKREYKEEEEEFVGSVIKKYSALNETNKMFFLACSCSDNGMVEIKASPQNFDCLTAFSNLQ
jgi:predicted DNA-binding protein (MmcQ/YjbR family)